MSEGSPTIRTMGTIVHLEHWRRLRQAGARPPRRETGQPRAEEALEPDPDQVARLERAIECLSPLVSRAMEPQGRLERTVETELLAIMGELAMGLTSEAAGRAEQLAGRLSPRPAARRPAARRR